MIRLDETRSGLSALSLLYLHLFEPSFVLNWLLNTIVNLQTESDGLNQKRGLILFQEVGFLVIVC